MSTRKKDDEDAVEKINPRPKDTAQGNADVETGDDATPVGSRKENETDANRSGDGQRDRAEQGL